MYDDGTVLNEYPKTAVSECTYALRIRLPALDSNFCRSVKVRRREMGRAADELQVSRAALSFILFYECSAPDGRAFQFEALRAGCKIKFKIDVSL